ncbi:T9SS type A sorting domain-containing protein [Aquimarina pacifica]|uniref:T9SS type A sorting domain-containing protein n=1 Tax=Aquimarina pacifica TaxID=1296415 RepID=UPI000471CEDC|nr:T9SS type A sorting domain-containing protein [Aquimarina pacifica]
MRGLLTETYDSGGNSFSVYPNPLRGEVYIDQTKHTTTASYEIFDLEGHLIQQNRRLSIRNTVSLTSLPSGMYTIRVQDGNNILIKNFLKL